MQRQCQWAGCTTTFEVADKSKKKYCPVHFRQSLSEGAKKGKAAQTPEQRKEQARKAGAAADKSLAVRRQWESIKKGAGYADFCDKRSKRMEKVWENYDDTQKEFILKQLIQAKETFRSKLCDEIKEAVVKAGMTGFVSEEYFNGYFPDEINYEKKLILEINGDYFHCNPRDFHDPEQYLSFLKCRVRDRWEHDAKRTAKLESLGYKVLVVWESDWKSHPHRELEKIKRWYQLGGELDGGQTH